MGTRNLIAVQIDGNYKVAQYGQWDGYPSGQGVGVLDFLRNMDRDDFMAKVRAAKFLSADEVMALWTEVGADPASDFVSYEISSRFAKKHPHLSRDAGSDVLAHIANAEPGIGLKDSIAFAGDSLFCEYAYVIDFDKNTFEIFKGFNKEPLDPSERFASAPKDGDDSEYTPVRLIKTYPLDALPTEEQFLAELEPREEEEPA